METFEQKADRLSKELDEAREVAKQWRDLAWGEMSEESKTTQNWYRLGFDLPWENGR